MEAITANDLNANAIMQALNTTGLIYQDRRKLDSADYFFHNVLEIANTFKLTLWKGIARGNLGKSAYFAGDYEAAMPLLKYDYYTAMEYGDFGLAAGSGTIIADIYLRENKMDSARLFLDRTFENIQKSAQRHRFRLFYPVMAVFESKMGNTEEAIALLDSASFYEDLYQREFNTRLLLRVNQKEYQTRMFAMRAEEARKRTNWVIGVSSLGFAVLLLGLGIFWSRKNMRMNRFLSAMEIEKKNRELHNAELQLGQFVHKIVQNEEIIQSLLKQKEDKEDRVLLEELRKSRILTEYDWEFFKSRFQVVYSGFIDNLIQSDLTQSEIRYLSLVKLGLSKREIATALGVSPNSLRVTWHRIRKKIKICEGISPEKFTDLVH